MFVTGPEDAIAYSPHDPYVPMLLREFAVTTLVDIGEFAPIGALPTNKSPPITFTFGFFPTT
jgi:hypothetical protein